MGKVEIILPKMGESVAEATVTNWLVAVGDKVEIEDGLLEIATDKVDSEIPSTHDGVLIEMLCKEGDVVQVGQPVAIIEIEGETELPQKEKIELVENQNDNLIKTSTSNNASTEDTIKVENPKLNNDNKIISSKNNFFSPLVKSIAQKEGLSVSELDSIVGTGKNNRITKTDVLEYLSTRGSKKSMTTPQQLNEDLIKLQSGEGSKATASSKDEVVEMDRVRKLIAKHMLKSKQVAPHVTSFVEADVTNMVRWRNKVKNEFQAKEGIKITFTPLFIEAVAKTLKDFPMVNISVDGDNIIIKKDINIGMAVALPSGNLIVPVIKNADTLNLLGITKKVNELSDKARRNKLTQNDVTEGTFTITNAGTFGNIMGTPIINQPEVAILATGVIEKKPAVIETPEGDVIAIRHKIFLSMSYDHRVVDGMLGGSFLRRVADYLENFDFNRQIW